MMSAFRLFVSDGDFDIYTWLDDDGSNLLDDFRRRSQINEPLVDSHLVVIPGFGTFTTRSFSGGDPECPGGHPDWSLDVDVLVNGSPFQFSAHLG